MKDLKSVFGPNQRKKTSAVPQASIKFNPISKKQSPKQTLQIS